MIKKFKIHSFVNEQSAVEPTEPKKQETISTTLSVAQRLTNDIFRYIPEIYRLIGSKTDISYIDYDDDEDDTISYLPANKVAKVFDPYKTTSRQKIKVGRFFRRILPGSTDKQIEDLVYRYKALYDQNVKDKFKNFEIVKGADIRRWYKMSRYHRDNGSVCGSLGASCMKIHKLSLHAYFVFKLYTRNPDKINLLIYKDEHGKLMGRALLWNLDAPENTKYLDRIYTTDNGKIQQLYIDYAKKNGWYYQGNYPTRGRMIVYIKHINPAVNPYMDTFKYYYKDEKYLTNQPAGFAGYKGIGSVL